MNTRTDMLRAKLLKEIKEAEQVVKNLYNALGEFNARAENNIYASLAEAAKIEDVLETEASDACAGSGNCGLESYTQLFMVGDKTYQATLHVEYNRHDKQYYYVDGSKFTIEEVL